MWSVKLGSGITDCTPLMKAMFGLTPESATPVGNQWLSGVHPDDRDQVESAWSKSLAHFTPFEAEYRVVWPDGSRNAALSTEAAQLVDCRFYSSRGSEYRVNRLEPRRSFSSL